MSTASTQEPTFLGHPAGLFVLFFAEMWERFSFYGMRALLLLYMLKGFLAYDDARAYAVYGAYTSLVYMTPFFGGLLADRYLGPRVSVIIGGLLMAAGHLVMTQDNTTLFLCGAGLAYRRQWFFQTQYFDHGRTTVSGGEHEARWLASRCFTWASISGPH